MRQLPFRPETIPEEPRQSAWRLPAEGTEAPAGFGRKPCGARLVDASGGLFQRTLLMVLYGTGMRRSEIVRLKIGDIDSQRMVIHVVNGKGAKSGSAIPPFNASEVRLQQKPEADSRGCRHC